MHSFSQDTFDRHIKVGDRKRIEGVFRSADDNGIVLYGCRFVSESK